MLLNKQKKLGQVFLKNNDIIQKIVQTANIKSEDQILEIGPGKGVLTENLLKTGAKIIAVEKDPCLVKYLEKRFADNPNLNIIQADIRNFLQNTEYKILNTEYKAIGNIPYYLTSHLIQLLLESENQPQIIVLMVQKEVAQRIIAEPPKMSLLSVSVQFYAKAKIICYVDKTAFYPEPKVDSAVIKITPYPIIARSEATRQSFFKVVKSGFKQPRKLLINNLCKNLNIKKDILQKIFLKLNIPLDTRAQNLSIKEWISLSSLLMKNIV